MAESLVLKVKLNMLRQALDDEFTNGNSIEKVREIYNSIRETEELLYYSEGSKVVRN